MEKIKIRTPKDYPPKKGHMNPYCEYCYKDLGWGDEKTIRNIPVYEDEYGTLFCSMECCKKWKKDFKDED